MLVKYLTISLNGLEPIGYNVSCYGPDPIVVYEVRCFTACSENNLLLHSCLINMPRCHQERTNWQNEHEKKNMGERETNCIMFSQCLPALQ